MPTKQKSGLYRTKIKVGVDADGKSIFKYISGRTRRELEDARREVEKKYLGLVPSSDPSFLDYAQKYMALKVASGASESTLQSYRTAFDRNILPTFAYRLLRTITPGELQNFVFSFRGQSATKITVIIASLRGVFSLAMRDQVIQHSPMDHIDRPPAARPKEKRVLAPEERPAVVSVCKSHPRGGYLAAMYYLGCRPGEARGLQWGDFNWTDMTVHIQRDIDNKNGGQAGSLKTVKSDRVIPVPRALAAILQPVAGAAGDYCFPGDRGGPLSKTSSERVWTDLMLACGLVQPVEHSNWRDCDIRSRYVPVITPHAIRHNFITMCWENGLDAYTTMQLVGHSSIKTTMDIYTHLSNRARTRVGAQLDAMFSD